MKHQPPPLDFIFYRIVDMVAVKQMGGFPGVSQSFSELLFLEG